MTLYKPYFLLQTILFTALLLLTGKAGLAASNDINHKLPSLGASSTIIPLAQEHDLGRAWLSAFRQRSPVSTDPIAVNYIEDLVYHLVPFADMENYDVLPILVQSHAINAFAVPGGILGINTGLLLNADTEDQLASVIAHELAHISQRHFARSQQRSTAPAMAAILAGIIAVAAGAPDAGIATITAAQAASLQSQLAYSRQYEREADRTGLNVLANAGFAPEATSEMFKIMLDKSRLNRSNSNALSFLSSHPITESRVADTKKRAESLTQASVQKPSSDFELIKASESVKRFSQGREAIEFFLNKHTNQPNEVNTYGLAMAYLYNRQAHKAIPLLKGLINHSNNRIIFNTAYGQALIENRNTEKAVAWFATQYQFNPHSYPVASYYAKALEQNGDYAHAKNILVRLSQQRSHDPNIWYTLAEVCGLAGDINQLHLARAEYFTLTGRHKTAEKQLLILLESSNLDDNTRAKTEQRLTDIRRWQERIQF